VTQLHVGFAGYVPLFMCKERERTERLAALLTDRRWPWPLRWVLTYKFGVVGRHDRARRISGAKDRPMLVDCITSPATRRVELEHHCSSPEDNHVSFYLESGQHQIRESEAPFDVCATTHGHDLPDGADLARWIELVHEMAMVLDVRHAVVPVWPTWMMLRSDLSFHSFVLDTGRVQYAMGVVGPFERQVDRANHWRRRLGSEYVRHPRWGNYLRREQLDRVGGLDKIRSAVPLAKVVELGEGLVYLQCTEHPATALAPQGARVRQLLEDALAPILVPAIPSEETAVQLPPLPAKRR
jgi:hypothetical protein